MPKHPTSIQELIGRWKSIADFAADVGCEYEAARQMKLRNSIAPWHWPSVIKAAEKRGVSGVSLEWLTKQRAMQRKAGAAA